MEFYIEVLDQTGMTVIDAFYPGGFQGLSIRNEIPGGMLGMNFLVLGEYDKYYPWAEYYNWVKLYYGPWPIWTGRIADLERYQDSTAAGMKVFCLGLVDVLTDFVVTADLDSEKGSTYIADHISSLAGLSAYITEWDLDVSDYTIPTLNKFAPYTEVLRVLESINSFNGWDWYVWHQKLHFGPPEENISYLTSVDFCSGGVRQGSVDHANKLYCIYRDTDGNIQSLTRTATSDYPEAGTLVSLGGSHTAGSAGQVADGAIALLNTFPGRAPLTVFKVWDVEYQEVPLCQVEVGKIIHVIGLLPARATYEEIYVENDINTFEIMSTTYDAETDSLVLAPGSLPDTLDVLLNRAGVR